MSKQVGRRRRTNQTIEVKAKPFKRRFDMLLRHVKLILIQLRTSLPAPIWEQLLHETRSSVISHPTEYLGPDLPDKKIVREAIHQVFDGFVSDMHVRDVQSFRKL